MMENDSHIQLLLLEDDPVLSREICDFFKVHEIVCDPVFDGNLVQSQLRLKAYDLAILDINVPGKNGLEVCNSLRLTDSKLPVLMLTAFGEIEDKIKAYNLGADDYLVKPFHFEELLLRVKSLLRRKELPQSSEDLIKIGDLTIDKQQMKVERGTETINLSPKEFKLLMILAQAKGRVLSKSQIAEKLWDYHIETNHNTIEVYINFLRNKIDKAFDEKLIHTKVGYGYFLKNEAES